VPGHQVCQGPASLNESCGPGRPCVDGLNCHGLKFVCVPPELDLTSGEVCGAMRMPLLQDIAQRSGATMSFGAGGSVAIGISEALETGVVYGNGGQFGCYATVCGGVEADVSISASLSIGVFGDYSDFAGLSFLTSATASTPTPIVTGAFTTYQVWSTDPGFIGSVNAVSLSVGISPIPASVGMDVCCTVVVEETDRLNVIPAGINTCVSQLEETGRRLHAVAAAISRGEDADRAFATSGGTPITVTESTSPSGGGTSSPTRTASAPPSAPTGLSTGGGSTSSSRGTSTPTRTTSSSGGSSTPARATTSVGSTGGGAPAREPARTVTPAAPVQLGSPLQARLRADAPAHVHSGRPHPMALHPYRCSTGRRLRASVTSAWDNVAVIMDRGLNELAFNDDTDGFNARVDWTCPGNMDVYIGVGAYSAANVGDYTLELVSRGRPMVRGEVVTCSVEAHLRTHRNHPMRYHPFQCQAGQAIQADVSSTWDNVAAVLTTSFEELAFDDDTVGRNARVHWTCPDAGIYYVGVGAYTPDALGDYTLQVSAPAQ
jgi:hypothetical protein